MPRLTAFLLALLLTVIGVVADALLKMASQHERPLQTRWFAAGLICFAAAAFGWVAVMKELKLSTIAGVYSVGTIVCLTLVGIVWFRESLSRLEILGLLLAVISLILLGRFGE